MEVPILGPGGAIPASVVFQQLRDKLAAREDAREGGRAARAIEQLRTQLDRVGYHLQQGTLALSFGALMRFWHLLNDPDLGEPRAHELANLNRRFFGLLAEDLANVERGLYPRELLFQFPIGAYLRTVPELAVDSPRIYRRRRRNRFEDLPKDADLERYPSYYRRTFHWQTDGWLSDHSARVYDFSVEILFGGTADVMRRMALPPIVELARARPDLRVLDLACGTGRFLLQLHRAVPRARLYGLDLSPHYVARARRLLAEVPDASFLVENAEAVPLVDGSFDAVSSVFLFHELPADARRNVAREALRLLRPGGRFVVCDATQIEDQPELGFFLDIFKSVYHEPYFKGYLRDDLAEMLRELGFVGVETKSHFVSKLVVGTKP